VVFGECYFCCVKQDDQLSPVWRSRAIFKSTTNDTGSVKKFWATARNPLCVSSMGAGFLFTVNLSCHGREHPLLVQSKWGQGWNLHRHHDPSWTSQIRYPLCLPVPTNVPCPRCPRTVQPCDGGSGQTPWAWQPPDKSHWRLPSPRNPGTMMGVILGGRGSLRVCASRRRTRRMRTLRHAVAVQANALPVTLLLWRGVLAVGE